MSHLLGARQIGIVIMYFLWGFLEKDMMNKVSLLRLDNGVHLDSQF